ncbi:hypothetical protein D9M69_520500 [compost metagenome]
MLFYNLARDRADVFVADAGIIRALWCWEALFRETKWATVFVEEIFLLKTEPRIFIFKNSRTAVRWMWRHAIRHHDFAHNKRAVSTRRIRINCNWL